jgi:hypothetical protein
LLSLWYKVQMEGMGQTVYDRSGVPYYGGH